MTAQQSPEIHNFTQPTQRKPLYTQWWGVLLLLFGIVFGVMIVAWGMYTAHIYYLKQTGQYVPIIPSVSQGTQQDTYATTDDPALGNPRASVVVVEFSDFQCPFCKTMVPVIKQLMNDYGDEVRFVYRDFPLAGDHPQAVPAAMAAQCAHEQGAFWQMHDRIFAAEKLDEVFYKTTAVQLGLDSITFNDCLEQSKYLSEIQQDFDEGRAAGVTATPTFFINGIKLEGAVPYAILQRAVLSQLEK